MEKTQELSTVKTQVTKATSAATELAIVSQDDLSKASDLLTKIKTVAKMITGYKEPPIKQAYNAYKEIKAHQEATWDPLINDLESAEGIIKRKGIEYKQKVDREAREKEAELARQADEVERKRREGEISDKAADKKIEKIVEKTETVERVEKKVVGAKGGAMTFKKVKKVTILDTALIPREFMIPNTVMINAEAKRRLDSGEAQIPGVLCELVDDVAGSTY